MLPPDIDTDTKHLSETAPEYVETLWDAFDVLERDLHVIRLRGHPSMNRSSASSREADLKLQEVKQKIQEAMTGLSEIHKKEMAVLQQQMAIAVEIEASTAQIKQAIHQDEQSFAQKARFQHHLTNERSQTAAEERGGHSSLQVPETSRVPTAATPSPGRRPPQPRGLGGVNTRPAHGLRRVPSSQLGRLPQHHLRGDRRGRHV